MGSDGPRVDFTVLNDVSNTGSSEMVDGLFQKATNLLQKPKRFLKILKLKNVGSGKKE